VSELWIALSLLLVIEGILPFLAPSQWRELLRQLSELSDRQVRLLGAALMFTGLVSLHLVKH
jgi:hypothetical protein